MRTKATFFVDGHVVHLIAGIKEHGPTVACVVELPDLSELHSLTVYFQMGSLCAAQRFVESATSETAERGYRKVMTDNADLLEIVNRCFGAYLPDWRRL